MKQTTKSTNGTSFYQTVIKATIEELTKVLGEPETGGIEDKITHEWTAETEDGDVFTVYDWKEYREFEPGEKIEWNIGGKSWAVTEQARIELLNEINPLPF